MAFHVKSEIIDGDNARHQIRERKYLDSLREKGLLIEIDSLLIDAEQLVLRTFQCNTNYCVSCSGGRGGKEYSGSCCTDLHVDVNEDEKAKIKELAELTKAKLDLGPSDPLFSIAQRVLRDDYTEIDDDGDQILQHRNNGSCVMSWMDSTGQLRCSINSLVEKLDLNLTDYKPDPCFIFPLHYAEIGQGRHIITLLSEETRHWIEQHEAVTKLRCLREPEPGSPPAYVSLRWELDYMLGDGFYETLDKLAQPILAEHLKKRKSNSKKNGARQLANAGL